VPVSTVLREEICAWLSSKSHRAMVTLLTVNNTLFPHSLFWTSTYQKKRVRGPRMDSSATLLHMVASADVHILPLTADREKARELGADDYLIKQSNPLRLGALVQSLQDRWLSPPVPSGLQLTAN
jgi:hypothetical protein